MGPSNSSDPINVHALGSGGGVSEAVAGISVGVDAGVSVPSTTNLGAHPISKSRMMRESVAGFICRIIRLSK